MNQRNERSFITRMGVHFGRYTQSRSRSASSATRFLKSAVKRRLFLLMPVSPLGIGVHLNVLSKKMWDHLTDLSGGSWVTCFPTAMALTLQMPIQTIGVLT